MDRSTSPPWGMLIVLIVASILSFVDRQILSLLVEPIKASLEIDDFAMGLLGGPAFAVFYAVAGLPLGWLADRIDRGRLIGAGIALWSAMTAISGFASTFWQLFVARIGVGVGEAALGPSAHSLIGERFAGPRLPLAMSLYSTGVSLGAGLAFALGGQVVALASGPARHLPLVGSLEPWQLTFVLVGLPGLIVALLVVMIVRDPAAGRSRSSAGPFDGVGAFFRARGRLFALYISGVSLVTASGFANLLWLPSVFIRRFGWTAPQIGTLLGVLLMTIGVAGAILSGMIATRVIRAGRSDGAVIVVAITASLSAVFALATIMPDATWTLALFVPGLLVASAYVGLGPAILQAVTPPPLRGRIAALALMLTGLFGMVAGPVGVGAVTSFVLRDPNAVGTSLAVVTVGLNVASAACFWVMRSRYRAAVADAAVDVAPA